MFPSLYYSYLYYYEHIRLMLFETSYILLVLKRISHLSYLVMTTTAISFNHTMSLRNHSLLGNILQQSDNITLSVKEIAFLKTVLYCTQYYYIVLLTIFLFVVITWKNTYLVEYNSFII